MACYLTDEQILEISKLTTASKYQMVVFRHIIDQTVERLEGRSMKSLIVKAVAGSGKTTTAVAANLLVQWLIRNYKPAKVPGKAPSLAAMKAAQAPKVVFLAFNKSIKLELASRLPAEVTAATLNSLGNGILTSFLRSAGFLGPKEWPKPDDGMHYTILKNLIPPEDVRKIGGDVVDLVKRCKAIGMVPPGNDEFEPLKGRYATDEELRLLAAHFEQVIEPTVEAYVFRMVREVMLAGMNDPTMHDWNDQKYVPVCLAPNGPGSRIAMIKYDIIFVDEAQDVNPVDLELIRLNLKDGGMVVAIGDENQAIYGFRGADVDSINNIRETFNAVEAPLSITYRCAKKIVDLANTVRPGIVAAPNAPEGEIVYHEKFNADLFKVWPAPPEQNPLSLVPVVDPYAKQRKDIHDMIVCRNNAPLVQMAFSLIRAKKQVHMMGRDFGRDLLKLIETLAGDSKKSYTKVAKATVAELSERLDQWVERQSAIIRSRPSVNENALTQIQDRAATIRVFIDENHDGKVQSVIDEITDLFDTKTYGDEDAGSVPRGKIILCSGHKSKGLEAERVFFLDAFLLFRRCTPATWQFEQETNLKYVILTRAKNYLGFIKTEDMK